MKLKKSKSILNLLAGVLFLMVAFISKDNVFVPIGCSFLVLSVVNSTKKG